MGVFSENAIIGSSAAGDYEIDQSLRFNDDDSAYLNKTFSVDRSANIWTFSVWFKRGLISSSSWTPIFEADNSVNSDTISIYNDKLYIGLASGTRSVTIPDLFRDPSAWYHLIISWDFNEVGLADTLKVWVNGVRKTNYSSLLTSLILDSDTLNFGRNVDNRIGARSSGTSYFFDGYLAKVNFIDGQALTPASFGETNADTNQWQTIEYDGSYGTNGFYLKFQDSSALGDDSSGNTNDFTVTNLAATDQVLDSPTNNFSTLNPLMKSGN